MIHPSQIPKERRSSPLGSSSQFPKERRLPSHQGITNANAGGKTVKESKGRYTGGGKERNLPLGKHDDARGALQKRHSLDFFKFINLTKRYRKCTTNRVLVKHMQFRRNYNIIQ